jgi:cephalosporin hydroxylase
MSRANGFGGLFGRSSRTIEETPSTASETDPAFPVAPKFDPRASLLDYHRARLSEHGDDTYAGLEIYKFPEDLRTYEHLLWVGRCNVVIELGSYSGASSLWFRDRLDAMLHYGRIHDPRVIAIDIVADETEASVRSVDPEARGITFVKGDVCDLTLPETIAEMLKPGDRPFVIEDSAHTYETTLASLKGFASFVPESGYLVVEDTCVDVEELRIYPHWPRGVQSAMQDWLSTPEGSEFEIVRGLEFYGLTCHPGGFLRRRSLSPAQQTSATSS